MRRPPIITKFSHSDNFRIHIIRKVIRVLKNINL